jgi:hypothetical protein
MRGIATASLHLRGIILSFLPTVEVETYVTFSNSKSISKLSLEKEKQGPNQQKMRITRGRNGQMLF